MAPFENVISVQKTFQTSSWVLNREEKTWGKTNMASEVCFVLSSFSNLWDIEPTIASHEGPPNSPPIFLPPFIPPAHFPPCLLLPHTYLRVTNLIFEHNEISSHLLYSEEPSHQGDIENNSSVCEHQWAAAVMLCQSVKSNVIFSHW